jgi:hypothetical protein
MTSDLFGQWPPSPAEGIIGMRVKLERASDLLNPCCENIAIIAQGKGPHAAQLCCENCWRHLGWLSKNTVDFLTETVRLFGVPDEPFQLCDATPGANPMRKADALPSKYVRATDLGDDERLVTIVSVKMEKVADGKPDKPVARFREIPSGLVINSGNWDTLADAFGDDSEEWVGHEIVLYAADTTMGGKNVKGTRVKLPNSNPAAKPVKLVAAASGKSKPALAGAKPDLDDEVPFAPEVR